MKLLRHAICALLAVTALSTPVFGAADPALTDDGLLPIQVKNIDKAWKRPGASLAGYQRILIRPVSVSFSKGWNPRDYGRFGLKADEVERIRSSLAKIAGDTLARELRRGGYEIVTRGGENVLDVEAQIVDLYVNAPEQRGSDRVRSFVFSAGEMRLLVTLRDAVTGTTLYRASDFKRGQDYGRLEWANDVWNQAEAERALSGWAMQLKTALDAARAP